MAQDIISGFNQTINGHAKYIFDEDSHCVIMYIDNVCYGEAITDKSPAEVLEEVDPETYQNKLDQYWDEVHPY